MAPDPPLRPFTPDDIPAIVRHANSEGVWRNVRDHFPHPYLRADAERFVQRAPAADGEHHFAIDAGGGAAGAIGLTLLGDVHRHGAELGYWLGESFRGRGLMTESVRAMVRHGFEILGLARIQAFVFAWNPASMRVLEKAGFQREGRLRRAVCKDGTFTDEMVYGLLNLPETPAPADQSAPGSSTAPRRSRRPPS